LCAGIVVIKATRYRLVEAVDGAQHSIAGIDPIDDDAKRVNIHYLGEG
jgi:hypothetical protein